MQQRSKAKHLEMSYVLCVLPGHTAAKLQDTCHALGLRLTGLINAGLPGRPEAQEQCSTCLFAWVHMFSRPDKHQFCRSPTLLSKTLYHA